MKLRVLPALVLALSVAACGPSRGGGDDDDDSPDGDADGDRITNADEGVDKRTDTDRDGTPDYLDDDSDGDLIPDASEAGDTSLISKPRDFDGDGAPDFRDTDSDDDTIGDVYEADTDYDQDADPNYLDRDSDGDCVGDAAEARGEPPADTDGDRRPDYLDRDSDDDGVPDASEDANCNGAIDSGETNPMSGDTDGDGVSDLIETAAGTDPLDPVSNPQANGDFVFIEPYQQPQAPLDQNLDFKTKLQAVDIYVLLDRSGSMTDEITTVKNNLASVVSGLKCPAGSTVNCIPDLWAGAGTIGYSASGAQAYQSWVDIQPNPSFTVVPTSAPTSGSQEDTTFAVYASITGQGGANYGLGSVPARASCAGSPAANAGLTAFGYPCFRQGALPVVLLATDEGPLSGADTYKNPSWASVVLPAYTARKAKLVGILGDAPEPVTLGDLQTMARNTGAVDAGNNNAPLVFDGAGANAATAIRNGILTLANGLPLDMNAVNADMPGDAVDAVAAFVDHIETLQLGTAQCSNGLSDVDTNGDTYRDKFVQVRTGTPVCWKVVSKQNTTVPATDMPQLFRSTITVYGDGVTQLDQRNVYFLVPPKPFDGPIF